MTQHGKAATRRHLWAPQTAGEPRFYKMNFPAKDGRRQGPVEGCPGVSATRAAMQVHIVHWHLHDTVIILEVALLQYDHGVVDVPVHEVHPHRRSCL